MAQEATAEAATTATEKKMSFVANLISRDGDKSMKRFISFVVTFMFALIVGYTMHWHYSENLAKFWGYCIVSLILLLSGVATVQDIIALKNGKQAEPEKKTE